MSGSQGPISARVHVGGTTHSSPIGIRAFDLVIDERGATLVPTADVSGVVHPTYLAVHPLHAVLYAVSETAPGEVVALRIAPDGSLTEWERAPTAGSGPCHLSTDGEHLVVADYGSGSACAHALAADGALNDLVWAARLDGSGPHPRQDAPHAHCAVLDPPRTSGRPSIRIVDLGTDRVLRYVFDPPTGEFRPAGELVVSAGAGPRHLAFHPHDPAAFVVCELDNTVVALDVTDSGDLVPRQVVSTVPDGFADASLAAAVRLDPAGRRLYASNRGHDSIAVFAYERGGAPLTPLGHVQSGGAGPRDIAIDPTGSLLLAANQHSNTITGFDLRAAGLPRPLGVLASVNEPTCILVTGGRP